MSLSSTNLSWSLFHYRISVWEARLFPVSVPSLLGAAPQPCPAPPGIFGCTCLMQAANSLSWPGLFHQQWLLYTCESSGNAPEILLEAKTAPRAGAEGEGSLGRAASRSGLLFLPWGFKSLVNKCLLCVLGEGKVPCSLPLLAWVVLGSCCPLGSRHGNLSLLGSSMVENGPTAPAGFK